MRTLQFVFSPASGQRRSPWITLAALLVLLAGMWALFLLTLQGAQEANLVHVPLPLLMLLLMLALQPRTSPQDDEFASTPHLFLTMALEDTPHLFLPMALENTPY